MISTRTPSKRKPKKSSKLFYACYLLLSVASQASNIVYIGSTPDPIRRLRFLHDYYDCLVSLTLLPTDSIMAKSQVERRKRSRSVPGKWLSLYMDSQVDWPPSRYLPTYFSLATSHHLSCILQFEWAWQNPHKSRHFKSTGDNGEVGFQGKQKERYLPYKLVALAEMFHLEHYKRWPLHLHFTSNVVYQKFKVLKDLPLHVRVTTGPLCTIPYEELSTNNADTETCM